MRCVCGCGQRAVHMHHAGLYVQDIRRVPGRDRGERSRLMADGRNLVPVALSCHADHHNASRRLPLECLPDGVFAFASWLLGPGPAYELLSRRYSGVDPRLDALLAEWEAEAA